MTLHLRIRSLLVAALVAAGACGEAPPVGQFGPYYKVNKQLRLASGDTVTVYRVKRWTFRDGGQPALQLEYEPPFTVDDTLAVKDFARRIWPAFAPYLEKSDFRNGIVTATNLRRQRRGRAWTATMRSFGVTATRDPHGVWRLAGELAPLPPADTTAPRIFEASGDPLPFDLQPETSPQP